MKSSRYVGVTRHVKDEKWQAAIKVNGVSKHLGHFDTQVEAAVAYDKHARVYGRKTNFSDCMKREAEEFQIEKAKIAELLKQYE